jgi:uncharacterized protein (TIGR00730 family)
MLKEIRYLKKQNKPIISFFGTHIVTPENDYYKKAYLLSNHLAKEGCLILSGGGAGIMEAANCGALVNDKEITSVAIKVKGLDESNKCAQKIMTMEKFFPRKLLLMEHSSAIVVFPGGMGTLDELTDITVLLQIKNQDPIPIYVIGTEYWQNFQKWFKEDAVKAGLISKDISDAIIFTDDINEVEKGILEWIRNNQPKKRK